MKEQKNDGGGHENGNIQVISEDLFNLCKKDLLYHLNEILPKVKNADYADFLDFDQDQEAEDERRMAVKEGGDYPTDEERVDLYLYVKSGLLWMLL